MPDPFLKLGKWLDDQPLKVIIEYLAARLDQDQGHRSLTFELEDGNLRRTSFYHHSIGNPDLEQLGRR